MTDKVKSIIAIMLIISTLSGIFLYRGVHMYQKMMNEKISATMEKTNILIDEVIKSSNIIYDVRLETLTTNKKILLAFNNRNREELYKITLPLHNSFKSENHHYSNMHFHLPTGNSFLRMHKPEEFGDDLRKIRPIIMQVHKKKKVVMGYEIGKHGLFYRVAKPMFYKGKYIGALELGIKAEQAAENIEAVLNIKVARFIDNNFLNDSFRINVKNEIKTQGVSLNPYGNKTIFDSLVDKFNFKNSKYQRVVSRSLHMVLFNSGDLKNYRGKTIAKFLIGDDISKEVENYNSFLISSVFLTLLLIAGAYIVLNFSFGSYINKIIELNKNLETKVNDRTKDLEAVTDELKLTNTELNQIFNTAADGMRVIDKDFNVLRVNDTFAKLIGKDKDIIKNSLCHQYFRGKFCFSENCTLNRILKGEEHIEIDVKKLMISGEVRSFLLTATPFKSIDGEILGVVENFKDVTHRLKAHKAIKEHEEYLNSLMNTVQAGLIITDEKEPKIIDANPYALKLIGLDKDELKQTSIRDHFILEKPWIDSLMSSDETFNKGDYILTNSSGEKLNIQLSVARANVKGRTYLVQSFSDITDVKRLIDKQIVDINKAKAIMDLVNEKAPRYIDLSLGKRLFTETISLPCNAEGGDHLFLRSFPKKNGGKTVISLKDQSGHEVNCIFRSIYTDLLHNADLFSNKKNNLGQAVTKLNQQLCDSGFFEEDDFFTSINAEIDHSSLILKYISSGHPPFILLRDNKVRIIPDHENPKNHLPIPFLRDAQFDSTELKLKKNDQIIFYTDGLTEMSVKHLKYVISEEELQGITQKIVDDYSSKNNCSIHVSTLMEKLLEEISAKSCETVISGLNGSHPVNTSADDVTMVGMEIETLEEVTEKTIYPKDSTDITNFIQTILKTIFNRSEAESYVHLKTKIAMILEEAVVNGWKHGNAKDINKSITVRFGFFNDFVLEIIDQGKGFDINNLPDPTLNHNIEKPSGRGLFIIYLYADHVQWRGDGSHIIISLNTNDSDNNRDKEKGSIKLFH
jgi:PAS domain S-box-containing protein